jgi:hypothetical protein
MGLGIGFSKSSCGTDWAKVSMQAESFGVPQSQIKTAPNPNPWNFTVNWIEYPCAYNRSTIMSVRYPDCTTFGGNKLLLLRGRWTSADFESLDPHFFEDHKHPVIARFLPNSEGVRLARAAAAQL